MDKLTLIVKAVAKGSFDSLKGTVALFYLDKHIKEKAEKGSPLRRDSSRDSSGLKKNDFITSHHVKADENKVLKRAWQCCLLNGGVFWLSMIVFEYLALPAAEFLVDSVFGISSSRIWSWVQSVLSLVFGTFWVVPLFLLSKIVNSLWFQDIADSAYRYSRGRPQYPSSIGRLIADAFFSILIQFFFLIQTMIVGRLPVAGTGVALVHMCLLYSLYSFEYKWYNMGWELHQRLSFIETNWPYFIGFGLPLALLTNLTSSYIISGCIFSILFPLFIISANEADPVTKSSGTNLQLFSLVVAVSNGLFNKTIRRRVEPQTKWR